MREGSGAISIWGSMDRMECKRVQVPCGGTGDKKTSAPHLIIEHIVAAACGAVGEGVPMAPRPGGGGGGGGGSGVNSNSSCQSQQEEQMWQSCGESPDHRTI